MLIDAHCHLDFDTFDDDRDAMFARAHAAGVDHFLVPGTTRKRWPEVVELGRRHDVSIALGVHPYFLNELADPEGGAEIQALDAMLDAHPNVVAVGECGIDTRFEDTLETQWRLFDMQLRIAKRRQLPVIVHCVHANDRVAKRLRQLDLPAGGLIHAFAGSPQQASRFLDLGFMVGLGGATTYDRAKRLHRTVRSLPDDGYVLETDSPDMPLAGFQGQRNEPARLTRVCARVAELRGRSIESVAECSTLNTRRLLGWSS